MALMWATSVVDARPASTPGKKAGDGKPAAREVEAPAVAPVEPRLPESSLGVAQVAGLPSNSDDDEEQDDMGSFNEAEEPDDWMTSPLFDSTLPSFVAVPPDGVNPTGPTSGTEWSAFQRSVRHALTRKDAGNNNMFMQLYRCSAHQEAYDLAASDCLKWVTDVRKRKALARLHAL